MGGWLAFFGEVQGTPGSARSAPAILLVCPALSAASLIRFWRSRSVGRESIQPPGVSRLRAGFLRRRCRRLLSQKGQCHQSRRFPDSARRPAFSSGPRGTSVAILKRKRGRKKTHRKTKTKCEKSDGFGYGSYRLSTSANEPGDPRPTPQHPLFLSLSAFAAPVSHFLRGFTGFSLLSPVLWPS